MPTFLKDDKPVYQSIKWPTWEQGYELERKHNLTVHLDFELY